MGSCLNHWILWRIYDLKLMSKIEIFVKPKSNSKSQIQVPNPSHKFKSKKLKSKVQRKRNGTGADTIILQATTPPPHHPTPPHPTPNFSPLKFDLQTSMRGQNGVEFYQELNGHVGFLLALLLADQWEADCTYQHSRLHTPPVTFLPLNLTYRQVWGIKMG